MSSFCTAKITHIFFSKKFQHICVSLYVNFNESLTNDVVTFEQPGLDCFYLLYYLGIGTGAGWVYPISFLLQYMMHVAECNAVVKSVTDFFSQLCLPGALNSFYNPFGMLVFYFAVWILAYFIMLF